MRTWCAELVLLLAVATGFGAAAAEGSAPAAGGKAEPPALQDALEEASRALDATRLARVRMVLDALDPETARTPRARYLRGRLLFFEGRFDESLLELQAAIEGARAEYGWKLLRDRVILTRQALAGSRIVTGDSGAFTYRHAPGIDAVLVPYAERALVSQRAVLEDLLGDLPDAPLEVVFLPDAESLAACSGLTVEQIERTGTVAVSKYGRIMLLTPRALGAGYPWLVTLAHELTHVVVDRVSWGRAPLWLHEGIAKLLEQRWTGEASDLLSPEEAFLLDRAAREKRLIPLRRIHPSVAHLPSQEDAALAYAQVASFLEYMDHRLDNGWLRTLLEDLGSGREVDAAFVAVSRFNVRRLYLWWEQTISGVRQTPVPAVGLLKRRYQLGTTTGDGPAAVEALDPEARRRLRLGDLLRLRGHTRAAVIEYREAERAAGSLSPDIGGRLAGALLEIGEHEAAAEVAAGIARFYPFWALSRVQLGRALAARGRNEEAAQALERANGLNPFDPTIHCLLAQLYEGLGRVEQGRLEREHCRLLAAAEGQHAAQP
jgi:tetratricopeptide (TPR) repeat protein